MVVLVEEVSSSLVREYLSRKGLKRTIACMDEEHPRTVASINNRSQLREILNIEDLYKKNKIHNSPFKTLLEIIVNHHIEQLKNYRISRSEVGFLQSTLLSSADSPAETPSEMNDIQSDEYTSPLVYSKRTKNRPEIQGGCPSRPTYMSLLSEEDGLASYDQANSLAYNSNCQKGQPLKTSEEDIVGFGQRKPDKNTSVIATIQRSRNNRIRRGMVTGPMPQESNKKRQIRRAEVSQPLFRKEEENNYSQEGILSTGIHKKIVESSRTVNSLPDCGGGRQELLSPSGSQNKDGKMEQNILKTRNIKTKPNLSDMIVSELVLDDIDDDDDDDDDVRESSKVSIQKTVAECLYTGRPMDQHIAMGLKAVLLGSSQNYLNAEWRNQGFTFSEIHDLSYGIVQRKGGPCGVLASIQAFVLKKLLFENTESSNTGLQRLRPSNATRRQCLILALAEILWRAGEEKQATVAINSGKSHFTPSGHFRSEGVLEKIMYFTVNNFKDLQFILEQHIEQFESGMLGCILLTISAILSRSIEKVREDMDVPSTTLIAAHGYCTQELVNLLLCGRAASNVFDNDMELDSGNGNMMLLKGIKGHCDVGLLSLFEHYNICKVGAYLKTPSYPIWVVCSESHFSVLFGLQRELLTNEDKGLGFDLYYYDGLANQQEEIRLTISIGNLSQSFQNVDTDLIPPLELCIRTRNSHPAEVLISPSHSSIRHHEQYWLIDGSNTIVASEWSKPQKWKDAFVSWNDTEPLL